MPIGIYKRNPEQGKRHSEWLKKHPIMYWLGKKRDKKTKQALKNAHLGKFDEDAVRWIGDKVGYDGLHDWVYRKLGAPKVCEECGKECKNNYQIHWANKSGKYRRDLADWVRLCVKCHWWKDQSHRLRLVNKWV